MLHSDLKEKIIKAFYKVYNTLGYGFLEKVYENAMLIELSNSGLAVENQKSIAVYYEGKVIVELKASANLLAEHEAQLINYLKATNIEVGLLLNFGKKPEFKRKIFSNQNPQ